MALRLACNLAVKIRVFYKTGLPGSAHRATPVFRSLTSPLCRSIKEHFRSSWHGRPSARIPYPSSPSPLQHVPSRFLFLDRVRGSTDPIQSIRRPKKAPPFAPVRPSFSPSFHRLQGHTKAGVTPPRGVVTPAIPYTAICPVSSPAASPASSPPPLTLHPSPACSSVPSLAPLARPLAPRPAALTFATRSLLPSPPPRTASPAGTHPLSQGRKSTVQERIIVPVRCGHNCRWPTRCRRNREPQSGRCHRQYKPSAGRSSLRP